MAMIPQRDLLDPSSKIFSHAHIVRSSYAATAASTILSSTSMEAPSMVM
jgi:hypothetical protein